MARFVPQNYGQKARARPTAAAPRLSLPQKVFQYTRDLLAVGPAPRPKRLPHLLTEAKLVALYEAIWHAQHLTHLVMLKLLLYTGVRNVELVWLRLTDVDLQRVSISD